jgi:hypothetical protein
MMMEDPKEARRRLRRRFRARMRAIYGARNLAFFVLLVPVCVVSVFFGSLVVGRPLPEWVLAFAFAAMYLFGFGTVALATLQVVFRRSYFARRETLDKIERRLESLMRSHPELVELAQLRQLVQDEKDASAGRSALWLNVAVAFVSGVFFLLLGYLLTKYHVLP